MYWMLTRLCGQLSTTKTVPYLGSVTLICWWKHMCTSLHFFCLSLMGCILVGTIYSRERCWMESRTNSWITCCIFFCTMLFYFTKQSTGTRSMDWKALIWRCKRGRRCRFVVQLSPLMTFRKSHLDIYTLYTHNPAPDTSILLILKPTHVTESFPVIYCCLCSSTGIYGTYWQPPPHIVIDLRTKT